MTVVSLLWPLAICLVVLGGIGGFLSWSVGLRGYSAAALAPAFAVTLISGTAIVASWVGVPFSVLPVVVLTVVVGAIILAVRRRLGVPVPDRAAGEVKSHMVGQGAWLAIVLVAVALVMTVRVMQIVGEPARISQTFDNVFHLNGVRYVLSEGDASSLRLGYMTSPDGTLPFYPAAWHGVTALVVQISGAAIPVAVNAVVVAVSAVVWPLSAVLLVRTLFGRSLAFAVPAALLAVSLPGFPILPMDYGVLYPFQLSLALMPLALVATVRLLRLGHDASSWSAGWWALVLVGIIPGLALAHPGGFVAWVVLTVPIVAASVIRGLRRARSLRRRIAILAGTAVYTATGALLLHVLRPPEEARGWPLQLRIRESALQAVTVSFWYAAPAIVAAVCVLLGVVWSLAGRRSGALIAFGMYAIGVGLFMTVASMPWPELRDQLTGSWYNNLPRLGAILAVVLVPIGAYGVARTWQWVSRSARLAGRPVFAAAGVGSVAAIALFGGLQYDGAMDRAVQSASSVYRLDAASPLLSDDEYRLLERIPQEVPEGVAIAGSVWTGASLASAISDRPILMPHTLMQISEPVELINAELDRAEVGSAVCDAVHQLNVGYVLDFGELEIHGGHHAMPGLEGLDTSPAVELVDREGDAVLYRVVGCG